MVSVFYVSAYIHLNFRLDFFMEASNMDPDETWEQSDLVPNCLQTGLPKKISKQQEQMTKVVTLVKGLMFTRNFFCN